LHQGYHQSFWQLPLPESLDFASRNPVYQALLSKVQDVSFTNFIMNHLFFNRHIFGDLINLFMSRLKLKILMVALIFQLQVFQVHGLIRI
jgi:hypothetical protein